MMKNIRQIKQNRTSVLIPKQITGSDDEQLDWRRQISEEGKPKLLPNLSYSSNSKPQRKN